MNASNLPTKLDPRESKPFWAFVLISSRLWIGLLLLALSFYLVLHYEEIKSLEAQGTYWLANLLPFLPVEATGTIRSIVLFEGDDTGALALNITAQCTISFVLVPLCVIAGAMMLASPRFHLHRVLPALFFACLVLVVTNFLRVIFIALLMEQWSRDNGYEFAHRYLGTILVLVALAVAYFVFFRLVVRGSLRKSKGEDIKTGGELAKTGSDDA